MKTSDCTTQPDTSAPFTGWSLVAGGSIRAFFGVACLLVGLGLGTPAAIGEESSISRPTASLPDFVFKPLYASNQGSVAGVYEARHADLILLEGGFNAGFRTGMICRVADSEGEVGEVVLVEVRNNCSAAVIVQLEAGRVIEPGHSVRIKTVKF